MIRPQRTTRTQAKAVATPTSASVGSTQAWCFRDSLVSQDGGDDPVPPVVFPGIEVVGLAGNGLVVSVTVQVTQATGSDIALNWNIVLRVDDEFLDDHAMLRDSNTVLQDEQTYTVSASCMIAASDGAQIGCQVNTDDADITYDLTMTMIAVDMQTDPCCIADDTPET